MVSSYCICLVACTYLELSTVCKALDVLLFKKGWLKWIWRASEILRAFSLLCWDNIEKLLMLTEVDVSMVKSGCVEIESGPMHESVCFLILLCSGLPMEHNVVGDKPAWHKLLENRQRDVEPMYDNSYLPHTYL